MLLNVITVLFQAIQLVAVVWAKIDDRPIIKTPLGTLRGTHKKSYNGRIFSSFEGIPYAKPPVGKLRFEKPVETEGWTGTWEAVHLFECVQINQLTKKSSGSEDCLYMNVYVPRVSPNENDGFDVIVHIHGGSFKIGNGHTLVKPTFFMDRDVIFVTFNYRLGLFGFLSTEDEVVPGNNGLKDQNMALKWIQKYIKSFGGNPNSVTLTGLSAGAVSVHIHYFSPLSKNLFQRGIAQSGVVLNPWALQKKPLEKAHKLASVLGCHHKDTKFIVDCLKQRPAEAIIEKMDEFHEFGSFPLAPLAPVVEKHNKSAFLMENPYKLLKSGGFNKAPLIISVTSDEGIFIGALIESDLNYIDENWAKVAPFLLEYNNTLPESQKQKIADAIKHFYFNSTNISKGNIRKVFKMFTDRYFVVGAEIAAKLQCKYADVYFSVFGYRGEHTYGNYFLGKTDLSGGMSVDHADDAFYLYDRTHPRRLSKEDEQMKDVFIDMYTSYARTGKPTVTNVEWNSVSDKFAFLNIKGPNDVNVETVEGISEVNFWNSLPINENEKLLSTRNRDEL